MTLLSVRKPTGRDIVDLLLLCAPKEVLDELEISENDRKGGAADFDCLDTFHFNEMFALSLFYACRSAVTRKKSVPLIQSLQINPHTLFSFREVILAEDFTELTAIYQRIKKDTYAKGGNETARKSTIAGAKNHAKLTWVTWTKNPKLFKSKAALATYVLDKFPDIKTSAKDMAKWFTEWERAANLPPLWWKK
ncbi:MAG: hypothetical protein NT086_21165 [Proteobacteria bacterium]|nr:hypothetical protein [Pseudomonadota bacterium]